MLGRNDKLPEIIEPYYRFGINMYNQAGDIIIIIIINLAEKEIFRFYLRGYIHIFGQKFQGLVLAF